MPVGPEFQDPPPDINQLPYFVAPQVKYPFYEQTVTVSGMSQDFQAVFSDPNKDDTLRVRWIANYPPNTSATVVLMPDTPVDRMPDGTASSKLTITCDMIPQGADHNLVVIISDNGFLDPGVDPAAHSNIPYNWDNEAKSQLIVTMKSWRITGCP